MDLKSGAKVEKAFFRNHSDVLAFIASLTGLSSRFLFSDVDVEEEGGKRLRKSFFSALSRRSRADVPVYNHTVSLCASTANIPGNGAQSNCLVLLRSGLKPPLCQGSY